MKADKKKVVKYLHMAQGQLTGIEKMINNDEYCINISNQLMASIAILKKINAEILTEHLNHCVLHASEETKEEKIKEVVKIVQRLGE